MSVADMTRENMAARAFTAESSAQMWKAQALIAWALIIGLVAALAMAFNQRDTTRDDRDRAYDIANDATETLKDMSAEYQHVTRDLDVCQTYVMWRTNATP